jgi:hypothetical protein
MLCMKDNVCGGNEQGLQDSLPSTRRGEKEEEQQHRRGIEGAEHCVVSKEREGEGEGPMHRRGRTQNRENRTSPSSQRPTTPLPPFKYPPVAAASTIPVWVREKVCMTHISQTLPSPTLCNPTQLAFSNGSPRRAARGS